MSNILFIKTSSLGDVIHYMPALSDARRYRPDARFTWVVEEAFAPSCSSSGGCRDLPVASRRWRGALHRVLDLAGDPGVSARAAARTTTW